MPPAPRIKKILTSRKLAPHKSLGQNFLIHQQTADRIVEKSGIAADDIVLELGVGFGAMTLPLAERVRAVIGLEIDAGIIAWHKEQGELPDNVTLIHQDILKADFTELAARSGGRLKIVANLPYSISNPLLFKLIEHKEEMEWATLMLQKEVAQRLTAKPGTKEYGILSVLLCACASVKTLMEVGPGQFHPRPKVDSTVVRIVFHPVPESVRRLPGHDGTLLHKLVKAAFQQRRKTLLNALSSASLCGFDKKRIGLCLEEAGIPAGIRAERLTVEEYVHLSRVFTAEENKT